MRFGLYVLILFLIAGTTSIASAFFDLEGARTQWSDDVHGVITDKRVDSFGDGLPKYLDYVLTMYDDGEYFEAVVSFKKYARVKIGDEI